jgi:hypothetical protein
MPAVTRIIQIFAFVALLLGGVASHDVAMAGGSMHAGHVPVDDHHHATQPTPHNACSGTGCEEPEAPCCVMGQCFIGMPAAADCLFAASDLPDPEMMPPRRLVAAILWVPFRPPVAG